MMKRTLIMVILIFVGLTTAALSASADFTGLNVTQDNQNVIVFGWLQILVLIIGIGILGTGLLLGYAGSSQNEGVSFEDDDEEE